MSAAPGKRARLRTVNAEILAAARAVVEWIKTCPHCNGNGREPYFPSDACERCGGLGEITYGDADHEILALRAAIAKAETL